MKEEKKTNTDWNLVVKTDLIVGWLNDLGREENQNKTIEQMINEYKEKYEGTTPFDFSIAFAASYLLFVYPQQTEYENLNVEKIDISSFRIRKQGDPPRKGDTKKFFRRIRNSLTHAHFKIENETIIFNDFDFDKNATIIDEFEAEISIVDYIKFFRDFMFVVKDKYFKHKN